MTPLHQIQLPVFEGPLDLLLRLIEREELDITTVALAQVTDQYLARLAELEKQQAKDLAEFLIVAAKLLLIKSMALLPRSSTSPPEDAAEDVGQELVRQLQIYERYKEIASFLHEREERGLHSYLRLALPPERDPQVDMGDVTLQDLLSLAQEAMHVTVGPPVGEVVSPITMTINDQINLVKHRLSQRRQIRFRELLSKATTRIEVIITLLALLELIKQDAVQVRQEQLFSEIIIECRVTSDLSPADGPTTNSAA